MGVPKFFRWISERYPTISQLIAESKIPEFDNLYLDMNGIIHNCTHKDSDDATFRMTEDKMMIAIFNYIEHLFGKIKPKKLFFMAIDGVAPRAKMNQQRARRFRTALDAEKAREQAIAGGVEMPKEPAFDSNCITPGTEFMARLTYNLKYFVSKKVSEDTDWQGLEIILSGHEVPGEGEHKIMEYIRLAKAQPDYNANVRHCLYGLDADLIMLGLLSHDPHFCLLREEVTFGRQSKSKSKELEHQNFFLMHLSVVREYLDHEFFELKQPGVLRFPFDMERVIDDFTLLAFFVGNDFLPNLPNLHINEGALALQFKTYKRILPKMDGYINEHGVINLDRLKLLLDELGENELQFFESECKDANWLKGKQKGQLASLEKSRKKGNMVLSTEQMKMFRKIKQWIVSKGKPGNSASPTFNIPSRYSAKDRKFVEELADALKIKSERIEDQGGALHLQLSMYPRPGVDEGQEDEDEDEEESHLALNRIFRQYERAQVVDISADEAEEELKKKYDQRFYEWKNDYYRKKFGFTLDDDEEIRKLTENYVEGLQWVLHYYYRGVASWPWFYKYHYSPRISDIVKGLGANLNFKLGQPFRPFEQLMGVLPDRSKSIVPKIYHDLMTSPDSPIIDFYPRDFELDLNGKKMDWEAVVKIPFIEEDRLLSAMRTKEHNLTKAERKRNDFGVTLKFTYSPDVDFCFLYAPNDDFFSSEDEEKEPFFPEIKHCHCVMNIYELPTLEGLDIIVGLCENVQLGKQALAGFPSLTTLKHTAQLGFHGVNVFQQESRNESMVITLENAFEGGKIEPAKAMVGKRAFVGYPFLQESMVVAISDELFRYMPSGGGHIVPVPHSPRELSEWKKTADRIENYYSKRMGMIIGPVEILVHVDMLKGMRRTDEGATVKEYERVPGTDTDYAAQTIVYEVFSEDQRFLEKAAIPIEEEFPEGTRAFFLGEFNYGRPLEVICHRNNCADVWISTKKQRDPDYIKKVVEDAERNIPYTPSYIVAREVYLNPLVLSKITSSFSVMVDDRRVNLGLNLKFEAKKLKVLGYSRRNEGGWEFSNKAIALIQEYMQKFPDFFAGIMRNPQGDIYQDTDFFKPSESRLKIRYIQDWLKNIESKGFEKVPLEAQQLDSEVVMAIERAMDGYNAADQDESFKRVNNTPRKAILKPEDAEHRLQNQRFSMGDRIVYVAGTGKVPIASRGTVIGLTKTPRSELLDVIFDATFMSGTTLGSRCSPFRGMTVPASSVLNLTNRQLIAGSRASGPPPSAPKSMQNGQQQEQPQKNFRAVPPPPPLTGGYANAVSGRPNGNGFVPRGRGGRGGFVPRGPVNMSLRGGMPTPILMQRLNQQQQNQNEQPTMVQQTQTREYHTEMSPAAMDQRRGIDRGRGRGGYRGRGGFRGQRSPPVQP